MSEHKYPGVAQLVAHLTGGQGVVSSSLATRTKEKACNRNGYRLFSCSLEKVPLIVSLVFVQVPEIPLINWSIRLALSRLFSSVTWA